MKIVKYNQSKTVQSGSSGSSGGGSGSSTTIEGGGSVSLDRTIWGKHDTGEDIDGHMTVNGDINIKVINYDWEEDDDPDGEDEDYDEGGGNLNVELKTTTKDLEVSNDAYIKKHLYINHSHSSHSGEKVCLINEVEQNAKKISSLEGRMSDAETMIDTLDQNIQICEESIRNNADEIVKLKERVNQTETDINSLEGRMSDAETMIDTLDQNVQICEESIRNNADEIVELKNRTTTSETNIATNTEEIDKLREQVEDNSAIENLMNQIEILKYGNYANPVILYSGVLKKLSSYDTYIENGSLKDCLQFKIADITDGLMTIELTQVALDKNAYIYVRSIQAIQEMSADTEERKTYYKERSNGAHWFEGWVGKTEQNKTTIYLREFHIGNENNDTWYSSSWTENGGIRAVNLTINGYINFIT